MDPAVVEVLGPVAALTGIGAMILIGMKMRYSHLRHTKLAKGGGQEVEQLTEAVDSLRDEVRELREGMVDLYERVEFTERMLTRGQAEGGKGALPGSSAGSTWSRPLRGTVPSCSHPESLRPGCTRVTWQSRPTAASCTTG
jgi:hypothetical protein